MLEWMLKTEKVSIKKKSIKTSNFPVFCMCLFDRVAFVMKKHLNTHLLGKHGVGTPKER